MARTKRLFAMTIYVLMVMTISVITGVMSWAIPADYYTGPAQIAVCMTEDPQHSVLLTWTTIDTTLTGAKVTVASNGVAKSFSAVKTIRSVTNSNMRTAGNVTVTQKAYYVATVAGLEPGASYTYVCSALSTNGTEYEGEPRTFKTAPENKDDFTFIYLSDTQTSSTYGKALTANNSVFSQNVPDASFIFIGGDHTDTNTNEGQWEMLFNQKANSYVNNNLVNNNFKNTMSDYVIASVQGNHDNNTLSNHLNFPATGGTNITYAFTYGNARFIMLNFENTATRPQQQAFLRQHVADAKAKGLWTIVCFHKSIYTGASHIADTDVINARQYWSPIFAELDVDAVLQSHDHVLCRGFVNELGENKGRTQKIGGRTYMAAKPTSAPLYYVGNHASQTKFYDTISYTASVANRITANYAFLDLISARPVGHAQNPDGPQTNDTYRGPTYISVKVTDKTISFNTYMFQYNSTTDVITTAPFLYDNFTVTRNIPENISADSRLLIRPIAFEPTNPSFFLRANADISGNLVVASFDAKGRLANMMVKPFSLAANGETTVQAQIPKLSGGKYRFFIFDDKLIPTSKITSVGDFN